MENQPTTENKPRKFRRHANCKPVLCYTKEGEFVARYDSAMKAEYALGVPTDHIARAARGERKTAFGFVWKYEQ